MRIWKWRIIGVALGVFAMNALILSLTPAGHASNLNCTTKVRDKTVGVGKCEGTGKWRLRVDCAGQLDPTSNWITQNNNTISTEVYCKFKARKATVEMK